MLIEILQESDTCKVEDAALKSYLEYSLERLPEDFNYYVLAEEQGYFCVVTEFEDLVTPCIKLRYFEIPSIDSEEFWEQVELIEFKTINNIEILEVLVHVDTDIAVSLIFKREILDEAIMGMVDEFLDK
jgi:hypothetical protein